MSLNVVVVHGLLMTALTMGMLNAERSHATCPEGAQLIPARFGQGEKAFHLLIGFPEVQQKKPEVTVHCQMYITDKGKATTLTCSPRGKKYLPYRKKIKAAADEAIFLPAMIGDEMKTAIMHITVIFRKNLEKKDIIVLPNHGWNFSEFGANYIGPQRIFSYADYVKYRGEEYIQTHYTDTYQVSKTGDVIDVKFGNHEKRREFFSIARMADDQCFIPGYTRDGPQKMQYREVFY